MSIKRVSKDTVKGKAIHALASPKVAVVDGGAAETDLTATGLSAGDHVVSALMYAGGVPSDVTGEVTVTADDTVQLSTTDSTGNKIVINAVPA